MSQAQRPPQGEEMPNDEFEQELMKMWQESTCPIPGVLEASTLNLAERVARFDRKIFWQKLIESVAIGIVLVRSGLELASGDGPLIRPLGSVAAAIFIGLYLWRKNRNTPRLDPAANAKAYRDALLNRIDRQIELAQSVRYWYVLPVWLIFLGVFVSGAVMTFANPAASGSALIRLFFLMVEFLLATGICVLVIWLNERHGLPKLRQERERVKSIRIESSEEAVRG